MLLKIMSIMGFVTNVGPVQQGQVGLNYINMGIGTQMENSNGLKGNTVVLHVGQD